MQPSKTTKNIWSKMLSVALSIVLMAGFVSPTALAFAADGTETGTTETDSATGGGDATNPDTPTEGDTTTEDENTPDPGTSSEGDSTTSGEDTFDPGTSSEDHLVIVSGGSKPMYRVYNPYSGEHHYTVSATECDYLESIGWCDEGICWYAPSTSDTPIYRVYNPNAGEHHYTPSIYERDNLVSAGWKDEGIAWYSDDAEKVPVYRMYDPEAYANSHHYTTDMGEVEAFKNVGWKYEGIGWYGVEKPLSDASVSDSGTCGNGVSWAVSTSGELRISGNGTLGVTDGESWWYPLRDKITSVVVENGVVANANSSHLFDNLTNAKSISVSGLDTSNVVNMNRMFACCSSLTSLDLSGFKTSKVSDMGYLFYDCFKLTSLNLTSFNTTAVTKMNGMFLRCPSLASVNVSSFNTAKVTDMSCMFGYTCISTLDLSSFDISNSPKTGYMLSNCRKLSLVTLPAKGDFSGLLPTPSSNYIFGVTGKWVNTKGKAFTSDKIPANVADKYAAVGSAAAAEFPDVVDEPVEADVPASDDSDFDGGINFPDDDANKKFQEFINDKGDWHFVLEKHGDMDEKKREAIDRDIVTPNRKVAEELDIFIQGEKERIGIPEELDIWMTIRIKMTDSMKQLKSDTIAVFYVSDDGTVKPMTTYVEGDYVTFVTRHFSTYVVAGEEQTDNTPTVDDQTGTPAGDSTQAATTQDMYRLYNPNSGEHFYTASDYERGYVEGSGWIYEGIAWTAPVKSNTPVYRLYSGTDHHYTTSVDEKNMLVKVGWKDEGIGWYSDDAKGVPLYRQFNPNVDPSAPTNYSGSHNYTTSKVENNSLVIRGWRQEGIGWYGVISSSTSATDLGLDTLQSLMLKEVNAQRAANGSPALELDARINATAQVKAKDMCDSGLFSHNSAKLGYFSDQLKEAGISYISGGENIAYNQTTVDQVMDAWMNSEGHRANILDPDFTHLGVGYYNGYWVQQFIQE